MLSNGLIASSKDLALDELTKFSSKFNKGNTYSLVRSKRLVTAVGNGPTIETA